MADQFLQEAYLRATSSNLLYNRNRNRWQFLLNSYMGGDDYRRFNYLNRHQLESDSEYAKRLQTTPLDNQVRSIVSLYISYLFRESPEREFGVLANDPQLDDILEDADLDGRNLDNFMKECAIWSIVFGHCWIAVSKAKSDAASRAQEIDMNIRPYLSVMSPLVVTDWRWERAPNGYFDLSYIKYVEEVNDTMNVVKEWTKQTITTTIIDLKHTEAKDVVVEPNELGKLPFVLLYSERSPVRGLGMPIIGDIADQQQMIYNELSEVYESIRLDTHPSLVATNDTNIGTGAGSLIIMPENLDPNLKPYLLEFNGAPVEAIYKSINQRQAMINSMANVGAARATESRTMSGIAIETEFQLLNARLSEIADNLELGEEQIWRLISEYQGQEWDGCIEYPNEFAMRNTVHELDQLTTMKNLTSNPMILAEIDSKLADILGMEDFDDVNDLTDNVTSEDPETAQDVLTDTPAELAADAQVPDDKEDTKS